MDYECLRVERRERVMHIELHRPAVMNAVSIRMHEELEHAFDTFAADDALFLAVVSGAGDRAFCAGSDLKERAEVGRAPCPPHGYAGLVERFDLAKPVIAAVQGICLGGGFELALACDLILASESAVFGLPEPRVGAVALGGGLHRLARQIGLKQAMGMVLAARRVSAAEGERLGFVNEVVPDGELDAAVERWCGELLQGAPLSLRASKEAMLRGLDEPSLADALARQGDYPAFARWRGAEDTVEGPRAFAEKRPPVWRGR
ncbi:MAG: enoyl-CoA hydratase-related protein [Pseudomonadales bacterium]|jgi:crotonobetainyl-CoA hydratase|nr:enoyl-CoA hydratase-related protein [Pseudomonadales bacterium]